MSPSMSAFAMGLPLTGNLDQPARYFEWGPIQISAGNLVMILILVALFVLAILLPFPKGRRRP
jgi:hypothetical protein